MKKGKHQVANQVRSKRTQNEENFKLECRFHDEYSPSTLTKLIQQAKNTIKIQELPINYLILDTFDTLKEEDRQKLDLQIIRELSKKAYRKQHLGQQLQQLIENEADQRQQAGIDEQEVMGWQQELMGWQMPAMSGIQLQKQGILNVYFQLVGKMQLCSRSRQFLRTKYSEF